MLSFLTSLFASLTAPSLRPPGALNEKRLLATCIKCGRCMEVCPYKSITLADWGPRYGTPVIDPLKMPCYLCMKCPEVCPTGSLRKVKKEEAGMGLAHICNLCYKRCPLKDKAITLDDDLRPVIEDCVGCGVCLYVCPTKPKSILIKTYSPQRRGGAEQNI